jgi:hypothetical protein
VSALKCVRDNNLTMSVRSGEHNVTGRAICNDGIVIESIHAAHVCNPFGIPWRALNTSPILLMISRRRIGPPIAPKAPAGDDVIFGVADPVNEQGAYIARTAVLVWPPCPALRQPLSATVRPRARAARGELLNAA